MRLAPKEQRQTRPVWQFRRTGKAVAFSKGTGGLQRRKQERTERYGNRTTGQKAAIRGLPPVRSLDQPESLKIFTRWQKMPGLWLRGGSDSLPPHPLQKPCR